MRIEWLLAELDKEVRTYTDLRAQLNKFPPESEVYGTAKRDLQRHHMRLEAKVRNVLGALAESGITSK